MHYKYHHKELFDNVEKVDYYAFDNNIVIYGAGFQGLLVAHLLKQRNIKVICFADQDKEKQKSTYYGLAVISPEEMIEKYADSLIVVTPYVFEYVYKMFKNNSKLKNVVLPVTLFLEFDSDGFDELSELPFWYRPKTFGYYIDMFLRKCCNVLTRNYIYDTDISVTQKCNLKCKHCTSLMPCYDNPKDFDIEALKKQVDILCENRLFDHIFVEGGEPFIYKKIADFVKYLCDIKNIWKVIPVTNGTIIPNGELIEVLKNPKVEVRISDYGKISKKNQLIEIFEKERISYKVQIQKWSELSALKIKSHDSKNFAEVVNACCKLGGKGSAHMADGRLFYCPLQANLHNTGIYKSAKNDFVDLSINPDQEKIEMILRKRGFPEVCKHCNGRGYTGVEVPPAEQLKPGEKIEVKFE